MKISVFSAEYEGGINIFKKVYSIFLGQVKTISLTNSFDCQSNADIMSYGIIK